MIKRVILPTLMLSLFAAAPASAQDTTTLWIGTSGKGTEGIYRTTLDLQSGKLTEPVLAAATQNPGFAILNQDKTRLYAVTQRDGGSVEAYTIHEDLSLTLLNHEPIGDGGGAHLALDQTETLLLTAQYGGGSTAAFPILEDGKVGARSALVKHEGSGPHESRQKRPHAHWVGFSPDNRFAFVPDLGTDEIVVYAVDLEKKSITHHGSGKTIPGGGPRHMKFSHDGSQVYLLNELIPSVTTFAYDKEAGTLTTGDTIPTLTEEETEVSVSGAEIVVHPGGKFVYASTRGFDIITVYRVGENGKLELVEKEAIRGSWPRNFNIDATGQWLIAAGQYSNTLTVFKIDQETGGLVYTNNLVNVPAPSSVSY